MKPTDYYTLNDSRRKKHLETTENNILNGENKLLVKMLTLFKKNTKHYEADFLVHDLYVLNNKQEKFLWLLKECGSHLIELEDPEIIKGKWIWLEHFVAIQKTLTIKGYYLIDNKNLSIKKVTSEKAARIMAEYNNNLKTAQ